MTQSNPNIIFILADDMGYGDLACQNAESKIQRPIWTGWRRRGFALPMPTRRPAFARRRAMRFLQGGIRGAPGCKAACCGPGIRL